MRKQICGIYSIINKIDNRVYIGSSTDIIRRWGVHRTSLRAGKHHAKALQRDWSLYGEDAFEFSVIEEIDRACLRDREYSCIQQRQSVDRSYGYNSTHNTSTGGRTCSPETAELISKALTGRKISPEVRLKMGAVRRGCKFPELGETLRRLWANEPERWKRGRSLEVRAKQRAAKLGRKLTEEWRAKISQSLRGKVRSEEHRANLSAAITGKKYPSPSTETLAKRSLSLKAAWERRRQKLFQHLVS